MRRRFPPSEGSEGGGGGRPLPEPQGVQSEARFVPTIFPEDTVRDGGKGQRDFRSPVEMLVNTVSHMQRDLAILGHT